MANPVPLMIISPAICKKFSKPFEVIFRRFRRRLTFLKKDLQQTDLTFHAEEYAAFSFMNGFFFFMLLTPLLFILSYKVNEKPLPEALSIGISIGVGVFLLFFILLIRYPKILAGKKAEAIEQNLVYALKDLLLQLTSGISLFNALNNIARAGYGKVSEEFGLISQQVESGKPLTEALEDLTKGTKSIYMRKTAWQLANTIKAGASVKNALRTIINELVIVQRTKIRDYAQELNLWSLLYMLFAVAIPTIGATMLVILSSFAGMSINNATFILFVVITVIVQIILIGFIKTRRPHVTF